MIMDNVNTNFINYSNSVHNNKYDYTKTKYRKSNEKVIIICPKHGEFLQTPDNHKHGRGCPQCNKSFKLSIQSFIEKANKVHDNKYNYDNI